MTTKSALSSSPRMYLYEVYGLCLGSEVALPLARPGKGEADIQVLLRNLSDEELDREPSRSRRVWGAIQNEIQFLIEHGNRIIIDNRGKLDEERLAAYVNGVLLATLLRQRGLLTLHGSAVSRDGNAIGFIGDSGWGKSTLAAFFCRNNYDLINDDLLVVDVTADKPVALPGLPQVQLREDIGPQLEANFATAAPTAKGYDKRLVATDRGADRAIPLVGLCLLAPPGERIEEHRVVGEQQALLELVRHSRASNLVKGAESARLNFDQCSALARMIPVLQLGSHRTLGSLPEVMATIEATFGFPVVTAGYTG